MQDMIRGIRNNTLFPDQFVSKCLDEIKSELQTNDASIKANALHKCIYLHMLGYNMEWAVFYILEVMSLPLLKHRHVGYLAASLMFNPDEEYMLMTTNLLQKQLQVLEYSKIILISCIYIKL